jgi:tetratricopeptide (TPR) repeat protein
MKQELAKIEAFIEARDIKKAEAAIAKLLRSNLSTETQAELLQHRARLRLMASRVEEAFSDLAELRQLNPAAFEKASLMSLLADCQLARFEAETVGFAKKDDLRSAQNLYQNLIENHRDYPNLGWVYYQNGRALLMEDRASAAESSFHKALFAPSKHNALTAYCYERLAFIAYYESRQPHQALTYLDKAIATYPNKESRLWLVQVYLLRSRVLKDKYLEEALLSAKKALKLATDHRGLIADASFAIAELLSVYAGNAAEMIEHVQRFMQHSKNPVGVDVTWSRAYEMLGDAYFETQEYEAAVIAYYNALACNPYHPWEESLHYRIACSYYQHKEYTVVIDALKKLLGDGKSTDDYRVYNLLGNAHFAQGQFADALAHYEKSLNLAPMGAEVQTMQTYYELCQQILQQTL